MNNQKMKKYWFNFKIINSHMICLKAIFENNNK